MSASPTCAACCDLPSTLVVEGGTDHEPSQGSISLVVPASLSCAICFISADAPTLHGSHDALWCRTRAKQEADAAADLQRDLARIEELTVEIRWDSHCMFRFSIVA